MQSTTKKASRFLALFLVMVMLFTVTYHKSEAATPSSTVSAKATLAFTLKNLKFGRAVQNFYIGSTYIYITQRSGSTTYLSRLRMSGKEATYVDHMTLNNFGHGQSLDLYTYNNENWFYIGCKSESSSGYNWSHQVARMKYEAGKTYDYTDMNRLSYMNYATSSSSSVGTTYRVAVGGNSTYTIFRVQTTAGVVTYSIYDTVKLNKLLDASKSVQMNTAAARACCLYYFKQSGSSIVRPNSSFQGIDMTTPSNIYVSGGAHGDTPMIAKMNKSGSYLKLFKITNVGNLEIEGVQCKNDLIYFTIVTSTDSTEKKNCQKIYAIQESGTAPTVTAAPTVKPTATPTVKPTATPTVKPTATPTVKPTATPTVKPTATPTVKPTTAPTVAPTTAAPIPSTAPTGHPQLSTSLTSGTSTFTVAEVAKAANQIVSHYDTYKALDSEYSIPKAVTVGNHTITDEQWAYMAGYAVNGLSGSYAASGVSGYTASTALTYKAVGEANVDAATKYTGTSLTVAQVAEASWKAFSNYANNNGRVAASCGSMTSIDSAQVSYYSVLLATARALAYYSANGTLPTTVEFNAVNYLVADTDSNVATATPVPTATPTATPTQAPAGDSALPTAHPKLSTSLVDGTSTFTVAEVAQAANQIVSHYDTYKALDSEYSMPKAVTVNGQTMTDEQWAYMAGYAVNGLSGSYTASGVSGYTANTALTYKAVGKANVDANTNYTGTSLTLAEVAEASWKVFSNYANNNDRVAASCGSIASINSAQISYYSVLLATARVLAYYSANGTLPATVEFDAVKYLIADTDSNESTVEPVVTAAPTQNPTSVPTEEPTEEPTVEPTQEPTEEPTEEPEEEIVPTEVPEDAEPTPEAIIYPESNILYSGYSIYNYTSKNPGTLPSYSNINGTFVGMPELLGVYAQYIVDSANGIPGNVSNNSITETEQICEQLTPGNLTKDEYVALAQNTLSYMDEYAVAPGYLKTPLGSLSFNTLIETFAKVISDVKATGILPDAVAVEAWESPLPIPPEEHLQELKRESVLYAANSIYNYVVKNNKYPAYVTIDGEKVYMTEFIGVLAQLILNENEDVKVSVTRNNATFVEKSYENITGTALTKDQYIEAAQYVSDYIEASLTASVPGYVETEIGTIAYESLLKVFAHVGAVIYTTDAMPESVDVASWATALPTPPAQTEAPEYQSLVFFEILKGARRVVTTIEDVGYIPTYVTLDVGTRVYPGTMLRLFAATVSNINRGKTADMPLMTIDTPKNIVSETLTTGTLTKTQYVALATRIANVIYSTDAIPAYVTSDLGTMNYCNMIYMFSRIIEYYLTYGFLPETVDVQAWGTYEF